MTADAGPNEPMHPMSQPLPWSWTLFCFLLPRKLVPVHDCHHRASYSARVKAGEDGRGYDPVSGSLIGSVRAPATARQKLKLIIDITVYKGAPLKNLGPVSLTRQAVEIAVQHVLKLVQPLTLFWLFFSATAPGPASPGAGWTREIIVSAPIIKLH
jgi:hypothetical protein